MAAITWDDFIRKAFPRIPDNKAVWITKSIAALIGVICMGAAFLSSRVGTVFEASYVLSGAPVGPLFAIFFMGMFFPCVNAKGAICGLVGGQMACLWITIGGIMSKKPFPLILPTSTDGCDPRILANMSHTGVPFDTLRFAKVPTYEPQGMNQIYHISHFMVPVFGFIISVVIGLLVSLFTGGNRGRRIDPLLMSGITNRFRDLDGDVDKDRDGDGDGEGNDGDSNDSHRGYVSKSSVVEERREGDVVFLNLKLKSENFDD
jgi:Na+/proline symporter